MRQTTPYPLDPRWYRSAVRPRWSGVDLAGAQTVGAAPGDAQPDIRAGGQQFHGGASGALHGPLRNRPTNPDALTVTMSYPYGFYGPNTGVVSSQNYSGSPGVPLTSVLFAVPSGAPGGHFIASRRRALRTHYPRRPRMATPTSRLRVRPCQRSRGPDCRRHRVRQSGLGACSPGPGQPAQRSLCDGGVLDGYPEHQSPPPPLRARAPISTVDVEWPTPSSGWGQYFIQGNLNTDVYARPNSP